MKKYIFIGMLLSTAAYAQQQEFTIKLTGPELDIIGRGLGEVPFKDAAPILQKLREQVAAQQQNLNVQQQQKSIDNSDKKN